MQISTMKFDWLKALFQVHERPDIIKSVHRTEQPENFQLEIEWTEAFLCVENEWMNWEVNFPKQSPSEDCLDFVRSLYWFKSFNLTLKGSESIPFKLELWNRNTQIQLKAGLL